ncbi:response regulator transcription factor [Streptomyces sp. NPDC012746]|uniref:response regulator transcription factor n=1 Tax=Streptomyces sp. NPDC012746 TaxID=3364845 RepID=UPI0036933819
MSKPTTRAIPLPAVHSFLPTGSRCERTAGVDQVFKECQGHRLAAAWAPAEYQCRAVDVRQKRGEKPGLERHPLLGTDVEQLAQHHLGIGAGTVKTHVRNLLIKLGARDRVHLVIAAYDAGLVTPPMCRILPPVRPGRVTITTMCSVIHNWQAARTRSTL